MTAPNVVGAGGDPFRRKDAGDAVLIQQLIGAARRSRHRWTRDMLMQAARRIKEMSESCSCEQDREGGYWRDRQCPKDGDAALARGRVEAPNATA